MKLFITNKNHFESVVKESRVAHVDAYNRLNKSVSENSIPITLIGYFDVDETALFQFKSTNEGIFYYEFTGISY